MSSRWVDTIDIEDRWGERIRISGPGEGHQGYFMAPNSTGLLDDAPVKTIWHKTMFGQSYSGLEWERRELVFTLEVGYERRHPIDPEREPDEWHALYADLRAKFDYDRDVKIIYGAPDGDRLLFARMIDKPKPFSTHSFEGKDPKLWSFGSVVFQMGCEFPFYTGASEKFIWEFEGAGTNWTHIPLFNPSDVPIWNTYEATEGARFHIPDYSWGNEYYGRGQADLDKMVPTPKFERGESCDIHTRPDEETYQSANDAPVGLRANGIDFEYPIPPGEGVGAEDPDEGALFMATDVTDGGVLTVESPRWFSSPFSRPRLVRPLAVA